MTNFLLVEEAFPGDAAVVAGGCIATILVTCGFALLLNDSLPFSNIELVTF